MYALNITGNNAGNGAVSGCESQSLQEVISMGAMAKMAEIY